MFLRLHIGTRGTQTQIVGIGRRIWDPRPSKNTMDSHSWMVVQISQQLWSDQEVLRGVLLTGNFNHILMNNTFVTSIHTLIDFINDSEGGIG
ncbi:hypothetical protein WICPIJ_000162 [Wickerhamomyces pijperi]|uniref:Uncharacterized protein n=1 Tax=Wickerhamomyces pijperi TaxID=599730 RepID=A0A9P8QEH2_WICPI|nr:hypothetical protein WICPIJ_000162 [Wickerhamomyces pijperi]